MCFTPSEVFITFVVMLEESVVYQDILQKGEQRGEEKEARKVALRQLELRFGKLPPGARRQIERLMVTQLEALLEALLNFRSKQDLTRWLRQHAPAH